MIDAAKKPKKRVAVVQSNYIPWKGYFDLIASSDQFVLYDDVQYTRRDWRNRNQVKTPNGLVWLTVPVLSKGNYFQTIEQVRIDNSERWAAKHWRTLLSNYRRATYFDEVAGLIEPLYCRTHFTYLSELNRAFIAAISGYLDINTVVTSSCQYPSDGEKNQRLLEICKATEATEYLSGPSAKSYLDEALFNKEGISVVWFSYEGYRPYPQLWGDFVHEVSILDLLFTNGKNAKQYMKGFGCNR